MNDDFFVVEFHSAFLCFVYNVLHFFMPGLEILSKLCQVEENESLLSEHLESKAYEDICKLLTIHDIQLIIYTLEALYQLSELGEATSGAISSVKHAVGMYVVLCLFLLNSTPPPTSKAI